jgi:hypothetical protein
MLNRKWEVISMDFIERLAILEGADHIFVVVDRLNKYAHLMAICKIDTIKQIVNTFIKYVYKLHGFLNVIMSGRDPKLKSAFCKELCQQIGI